MLSLDDRGRVDEPEKIICGDFGSTDCSVESSRVTVARGEEEKHVRKFLGSVSEELVLKDE